MWQLKGLAVGIFLFFFLRLRGTWVECESSQAQEFCRGSKEKDQEGRGKPWMRQGTHSLSLNMGTRIVGDTGEFMGAGGGRAVPCFSVEQVVRPLAESEGNVALRTRARSCSHHRKWEIEEQGEGLLSSSSQECALTLEPYYAFPVNSTKQPLFPTYLAHHILKISIPPVRIAEGHAWLLP